MFENGHVISLMRTVKGLQKCSMKAGQSLFSLFAHSPAHATRSSPLEYRPRGIAVHPARILEQKTDCSQSIREGSL